MNWSNEWPKTPATEKEIYGEGSNEVIDWVNQKHQIRDLGAEAGMPAIDQSIKAVKLSIIIKDGDFPTTVEAIQVGDLAVHHNLRKEGYWQVTHMPTLTRFNVVPNRLHKQTDLIEWCRKVQSQLPDDWKELAKLTHECYKDRSEAKDRIMYLCQGTEV